MNRIPKTAYAGIFLLALSIILFQIALTRVFAIMMWHHLTYMVVSIALLGFGAAGSLLTARKDSLRRDSPLPALSGYSGAYGVSVFASYALVRLIEIDSLELWEDKTNLLLLLVVYAVVAVPFLLGGIAIGMALTRFVHNVSRLYFTDLVGSAAGGALSVLLLAYFGGATTVAIAAVVGLAAALSLGLAAGPRHTATSGGLLFAGIVACGLFVTGAVDWSPRFAPGKELLDHQRKVREHDPDFEFTRLHSATAEVEVGPDWPTRPFIGGDFRYRHLNWIQGRLVGQDGTAPTLLFEDAGEIERFPFLRETQAASGYVAGASRGWEAPEVLVIGVGGGVDVMVALAHGAGHVTAVEINTAMIDMVTDRFDDYVGGLLRPGAHPYSDRIELVNSEGRSYMRSRDDRYDLIQMSGVDSFTALSTGAYTLSESYLYTTQAVKEFYEHLEDGGYINYSRFILTRPKKPRETLRLANIARTALEELGIEDPASHIAVFQGEVWASTMIKRGPFTRGEIDALERFGRENRFIGMVFDPLHPPSEAIVPEIGNLGRVRRAQQLFHAHLQRGPLAGAPVEDVVRATEPLMDGFAARYEGDGTALAAALDGFAALVPEERRAESRAWAEAYLAGSEGSARSLAEAFAQTRRDYATLLRGTPAERAEFLASYEYDISPCTDDKPFFFNYYRYGQLFERLTNPVDERELEQRYHPDFPVGHMVLLASLAQIALLALVLIFLPLRKLAREGLRAPGTWRYFGYFAALGMGFMFIEIVLMQKMVIFLGHPTYAVSVVLASLLGFAGTGALLYAIRDGDRCLLYGTDTALFPAETWAALHDHAWCFDLVILDHTYGPEQPGSDARGDVVVVGRIDPLRAIVRTFHEREDRQNPEKIRTPGLRNSGA